MSVLGLKTTVKESVTGFFVGGFTNFGMNETFCNELKIRFYMSIQDLSKSNISVLRKFTVTENINLIVGSRVITY